MITHLHPPTCSSFAVCLDRTGCRTDGFFGSSGLSALSLRIGDIDSPSSARIENDRTEMWMTVGVDAVKDAGRLFAGVSIYVIKRIERDGWRDVS